MTHLRSLSCKMAVSPAAMPLEKTQRMELNDNSVSRVALKLHASVIARREKPCQIIAHVGWQLPINVSMIFARTARNDRFGRARVESSPLPAGDECNVKSPGGERITHDYDDYFP